MRLGALLGPIADASLADTLAEQARTYAGEGFESLWSAQAIGRGFMITDPFVALSRSALRCCRYLCITRLISRKGFFRYCRSAASG